MGLNKKESEKKILVIMILKIFVWNQIYPLLWNKLYKSKQSEIKYNKEYCQDFIQNIQQKLKDKISLNSLNDIKFNEINLKKIARIKINSNLFILVLILE